MSKIENLSEEDVKINLEEDDPEDYAVTIEDEDGNEIECSILTIFEFEGQDYIVLIPDEENEDEEAVTDAYIYRYSEDEEGSPSLDNIDDEDEYAKVAEAFDEWMEEQEINNILDSI